MKKYLLVIQLLTILFLLLGAGCTGKSPKVTYYTLSTIEDAGPTSPSEDTRKIIKIGIGPVTFPDELNRLSIVTRTSQNTIGLSEYHRWGGSLKKVFSQVMVENISFLMKTDQVMARPWERYFQPDIRIALDIQRFDGRIGEYAFLSAKWMIFEKEMDKPIAVKRSVIKEAVDDDNYDSFVAAQSRTVAKLSMEIGEVLAKHR